MIKSKLYPSKETEKMPCLLEATTETNWLGTIILCHRINTVGNVDGMIVHAAGGCELEVGYYSTNLIPRSACSIYQGEVLLTNQHWKE